MKSIFLKKIKKSKDSYLDDSLITEYFKDVGKYPILTKEQEYEYAVKAVSGDKKSFDYLICCNLRFVVKEAKHYVLSGVPLLDLISEGNAGMVTALKRYEPDRGFKFISYATWYIRAFIRRYLNNMTDYLLSMPVNVYFLYVDIQNKFKDISTEEDYYRLDSYLKTKIGFNPDVSFLKYKDIKTSLLGGVNTVSLSQLKDTMNEGIDSYDGIGNLQDTSITFEQDICNSSITEVIKSLLNSLPDLYRKVLCWRYGINTELKSLKEISNILHLSKERVRQIEKFALKKLKQLSASTLLKDYFYS